MSLSDYLEAKLPRMRPSEQMFITAAKEDRVFWRGEDIEHFKSLYEETQRMLSMGGQTYRTQAVIELKAMLGRKAR